MNQNELVQKRIAKLPKRASQSAREDLLGSIVLLRSSIWQNGLRVVPAIVSDFTQDAVLLPEGAVALVSVTAFPPGAPSRLLRDVPMYAGDQGENALPSAWLKSGE